MNIKKTLGRVSRKGIIMLAATATVVCGVVGGTFAWLFDISEADTVVFADSDIRIMLTELEAVDAVKMVPGCVIDKAPVVSVLGGSETCYLFVRLEASLHDIEVFNEEGYHVGTFGFDDYIAYNVKEAGMEGNPEGWYSLKDADGRVVEDVYYRVVETSECDQSWNILGGGRIRALGFLEITWEDDQLLVRPDVTVEMLNALTEESCPTLSFCAYAIQYYKTNGQAFTPHEAWTLVSEGSR